MKFAKFNNFINENFPTEDFINMLDIRDFNNHGSRNAF